MLHTTEVMAIFEIFFAYFGQKFGCHGNVS